MKKGTGKIIIGIILFPFGLPLIIWGWFQRRNPEIQQRHQEYRRQQIENAERSRQEMLLIRQEADVKIKEKKVLIERERQFQREYKEKEKLLLDELERKRAEYALEAPRLYEIIKDSVGVILKSRNVDTVVSRFDLIKISALRLFEIAPTRDAVSLNILNVDVHIPEDVLVIDQLKERWVLEHFKAIIDVELRKTEVLSDQKLKSAQLKKVLKVAMKSVQYLPNNQSMRNIINRIEDELAGVITITPTRKSIKGTKRN